MPLKRREFRGSFGGVRRCACGVALMTIVAMATALAQTVPTKHQIEAAFLYKFATFVEWPGNAFASPTNPIIIGVLGNDPFGKDLDETIKGQQIAGRSFVIKRGGNLNDLLDAHILFISSSESSHLPKLLAQLNGRSILTVSETENFASLGGMVNFTIIDNKIRFEINPDAARRADLKISSKLLNLARIVRESSGNLPLWNGDSRRWCLRWTAIRMEKHS